MSRKIISSAAGLDYLVSCLPERLQTLESEEEIFAAAGERIVELEARVEALKAQLASADREVRQAYFEEPLDPDEYRA